VESVKSRENPVYPAESPFGLPLNPLLPTFGRTEIVHSKPVKYNLPLLTFFSFTVSPFEVFDEHFHYFENRL
jgi:hypothetical protein